MLWHKGWLETRVKLMLALGVYGAMLIAFSLMKPPAGSPVTSLKPPDQIRMILGFGFASYAVAWISIMLAGAGIATQSSFQASKGLHGSTLFTLSLPVSRLRLLAVRAGLGWFEVAGFIGALSGMVWMTSPPLRSAATPQEMAMYVAALTACSAGLYAIPLLLATFLDDVWRMLGSVPVYVALWWLLTHTPLPASVNIFRAIGEGSPLVLHAMPWSAMGFSLALAAVLFFAALKIVEAREY